MVSAATVPHRRRSAESCRETAVNTGEETRALAPITAAGVVAAPPAAVFAFLSDLRNHWRLTGRWASLEGLDGPLNGPTGGTVIVRGPLGLRRRVQTSVVESRPASPMRGRAI